MSHHFCSSCSSSLVSLEVFSPAKILLIVRTTAICHSCFLSSLFSIFFILEFKKISQFLLFFSALSCYLFKSAFLSFLFSNYSILFSLLFLYIATIFFQSFPFSSNILYVLFLYWHTIMWSVVSCSVLQRGHVVSDSFLLYLHFVFHKCNLIFMVSSMVLLSHFLIH